ncbi:hypothetical protein N6H18_12425 [Reichenbachiella agarivorans]|uniref:PepSY-associated TM region n=1 Tax=Reichenbachiella agarivorans TaxID=2979464 RepID=A0ABY6CN21_9BACT|nr:hypothetical protein [Reichenbachiella agarivorans]UXP31154.1 hypothetical protein N6H18_12425 [Reichenbachiella agarivorans]
MRVYHRYLGFFLAGIMAVYALSGIVLIFRDTDAFNKVTEVKKVLPEGTDVKDLGKALEMKRFNVDKIEDEIVYFKGGTYDQTTRTAVYTKKELPYLLDKMTHMHKATSSKPLAFLNIFFGVSLFFFVLSSFWMFIPGTSVFKKGLYFALAGLALTLLMLFI